MQTPTTTSDYKRVMQKAFEGRHHGEANMAAHGNNWTNNMHRGRYLCLRFNDAIAAIGEPLTRTDLLYADTGAAS